MSDFRFGELQERTLHKQLKAQFCPADGQTEVPVGRFIADISSPTQGIIEIQTSNLGKLKPKLKAFLAESVVTVVHPLVIARTVVTWDAARAQILRQRKTRPREQVSGSFRQIGALSEFLLHPGLTLVFCHVEEIDHRCQDGEGSWRRKGVSRVDRELVSVLEVSRFHGRRAWEALLPEGWTGPSTNKELADKLNLRVDQIQSLTSCFKKLGLLAVTGKRGRETLLSKMVSEKTLSRG